MAKINKKYLKWQKKVFYSKYKIIMVDNPINTFSWNKNFK